MKALKEKRVSLRSLIRRGLVILSLFALVFASCSDSSGGGDNTGGTNGTDTPVPQKKAVSISILAQPVNASFQGMPPDLTGLIAQVFYNDDTTEIIATDLESRFATSPGYCNVAWPGVSISGASPSDAEIAKFGDMSDPYTGLSLVLIGHAGALVDQLKIPMVVGASKIDITGKPETWYSDDRPNFKGLSYEITYDTGWLGLGSKSVAGSPNGYMKKRMDMTPTYPQVDYKDAASQKKIGVYVGPALASGAANAVDGGLPTSSPLTRALKTNTAIGSFEVPDYIGVAGVRVSSGTQWDVYFDDDLDRFFKGNSTVLDGDKVYSELRKSNVKFDITYTDGKTKTLGPDEFIGNSIWYQGLFSVQGINSAPMGTLVENLLQGHDGMRLPQLQGQGGASILDWGRWEDESEYGWALYIDYAPWNFGNSAAITHAKVLFPVYEFTEIEAKQTMPGTGPVVLFAKQDTETEEMTDNELAALKLKWKVEGIYEQGRSQARKEITLTKQMFYDGYYGASLVRDGNRGVTSLNTSYVNGSPAIDARTVFGKNISVVGYDSVIASQQLDVGTRRADFVLPVYYRGGTVFDDEGILVELLTTK